MSGITVPTLDEITGHTVMAKLRSLCKRFIGLAEEVDEKIDAPLEEAHLAVETANATLATAQESLEDAQSAVTTANEASESAQESATTVAGYNTRLTAVENGKISIVDINNYAFGLTGEQVGTGDKQISNSNIRVFGSQAYGFICKSRWFTSDTIAYNASIPSLIFLASDDVEVGRVELLSNAGVFMIRAKIRNHDGTYKNVELIRGDN